jgi:leucyl aminopeptidase
MPAILLKSKPGVGTNLLIITEKFVNDLKLEPGIFKYLSNELAPEKNGKPGRNSSFHYNSEGRIISVVVVDTKKDINSLKEQVRRHSAALSDVVNSAKGTEVWIHSQVDSKELSLAAAEGLILGNYQFSRHKTSNKKENTLKTVHVTDKNIDDKEIKHLNNTCEATCLARDLVNEPVNKLNAVALAEAFRKMGKDAGFKVTIFNKQKITEQKMGGLLAVNLGSVDEPTFTIMEYKPSRPVNKKPVVLVGKGVVYDTGGLSLKPTPNSMDMMKCDMAGGAAVGGALYAIAKSGLNVHVIGLVPATDNRPGFNAYVPGDIITMMDGTTVEMLNADAEGRMILADALHYAKRYDPMLVIDIATLTGAAVAALGSFGIAGMGNIPIEQKEKLFASGNNVYERIAELPFWDEYDELLKSDIADQKNIGGPVGGAITAGKFLVKYTKYPYYHLDIAGPAFLTSKDSYRGKGATGVGVRLFFDFIRNL